MIIPHCQVKLQNIFNLHYSTFHHIQHSTIPQCVEFVQHETSRQDRLMMQLGHPDQNMVKQHLLLLKLCDEISLYVCLNKEGAKKEEEHPRYRDEFKRKIEDQKMIAYWVSEHKIRLDPFPFVSHFQVTLRKREVSKEAREQLGIERAFKETPVSEVQFTFVR
jgi:hypothetical protein